MVWGLIILLVTLNTVLWSIFYWRRWHRDRQLRLGWHLVLPLVLDILLIWLILVFVQNLLEGTLPVLLVFAPDLTLILLACAAVVGLTAVAQVVVYIAFARRPLSEPTGQVRPA